MADSIYFDNAATTHPKPEIVYQAQDEYSRNSANPGRGAYSLALNSARSIFEARTALANLLGIRQAERLVFTPGCTYSINMALKGLYFQPGDVVVVSAMEHNAVMRPLQQLQRDKGIRVVVLPYADKRIVDLKLFINAMLEHHPKLVVLTEGSNVTGETIDVRSIAAICGAHKVPLMVDAAQTAGRVDYRIDDLGISLWCTSGHKGMFGTPGAGLLYVGANVELEPLIAGGTGSRSEELDMPTAFPDHLEVGTMAGPAIIALSAGARYVQETGINTIVKKEHELTDRFLDWAQRTNVVRIYGNRSVGDQQSAVVSFDLPGVSCDQVAQVLDVEFAIAVRSGLHCAAAAHRALGTIDTGTIRASFGFFNKLDQVNLLCDALEMIAARRDAGQLQASV